MKTTKTVSSEVIETFCDVCGLRTSMRLVCRICQRDLCSHHAQRDTRDSGDYPDVYCIACWGIGEPFRQKIEALQAAHDQRTTEIEQEWARACQARPEADAVQAVTP